MIFNRVLSISKHVISTPGYITFAADWAIKANYLSIHGVWCVKLGLYFLLVVCRDFLLYEITVINSVARLIKNTVVAKA